MTSSDTHSTTASSTFLSRACVVHPCSKHSPKHKITGISSSTKDHHYQLEEATRLAEAINLQIVQAQLIKLARITPATYIGKGKVEELANLAKEHNIDVLIVNTAITPVQQRNLEKAICCKVIDRTALILEIFGERARTKEGKLQVELAAYQYQKSRLVRSWTHLERQRGGGGFLGGPGETQIEADRRYIAERIVTLKKQLQKVVKTRELHRKSRKKVPYPIISLVGYTNAGKSTLFNYLTGAKVLAEDALFATLDPTLRMITLPSGTKAILSDTVGFIADLPTELVAAFRATLEEVAQADIVVHVRDLSDPEYIAHGQDVVDILKEFKADEILQNCYLEVQNKIDLIPDDDRNIDTSTSIHTPKIALSARTGEGIDILLTQLDAFIKQSQN